MKSRLKHLPIFFLFIGGMYFFWSNQFIESYAKSDINYRDLNFSNEELGITGPDELCLYYGSIIGDFSGGGLATDVFSWKIFNEKGVLLADRDGGFQIFSYTFSEEGNYTIELNVRRGSVPIFSDSKLIRINRGVDLILQDSYLICEDGSVELMLINPNDPELLDFFIEWKDQNGQTIGNGNSLKVDKPGVFVAEFFTKNDKGQIICPFSKFTSVSIPQDYTIAISKPNVCFNWEEITLSTDIPVPGSWYYEKVGTGNRVLLGEKNNLIFNVLYDLEGIGDYEFVFVPDNSTNTFCKLEDSLVFSVLPQGEILVEVERNSGNCLQGDGEVQIQILSELDRLFVYKLDEIIYDQVSLSPTSGPIILSDLSSGVYSVVIYSGICTQFFPFIVGLDEEPRNILFEIIEKVDETCTDKGKENGRIKIKLLNGPFFGKYRILSINGLPFTEEELPGSFGTIADKDEFEIDLPNGTYFLELIDENGCVFPFSESFFIARKDLVSFDVPVRLNICGEFELFPNTDQNLRFELVYPDNTIVSKITGEPFTIREGGDYIIKGFETDLNRALCPREFAFRVIANDAINYEPKLVNQDCFGNKTYEAEIFGRDPSNLIFTWYNELDQVVGNGRFLFPTSFGEFKLDVQLRNSEPCNNPPKRFIVSQPVFQVEVEILESQYCYNSRYSILKVETNFQEANFFEWIYIDRFGNSTDLPQFQGQSEIKIEKYGFYEVVVYNKSGCEIGRKIENIVELEDVADFFLPEELTVCDNYNLFLDSPLDIEFIVTKPSGDQITISKGSAIFLDIEGGYIVESKALDPNSPLCKMIKKLNVTIVEPINYEPSLFSEDCEGNLIYKAEILFEDPALYDFYWYDSIGNEVGKDQFFQPSNFGIHQLEVRPKGSMSCSLPPKKFIIQEPVISIDIKLESFPICPDPGFTFIYLKGDLGQFEGNIKWYFTDSIGIRSERVDLQNESVIAVMTEGLYEAEVYNQLGCLLGFDKTLVNIVQDNIRPIIEEEYVFCSIYGQIPVIDPGLFSHYEWYLDENLVQEGNYFSPFAEGNYTLIVTSNDGCRYTTKFTVKEDCGLQLMFPNAIIPQDPDRSFLVYSNNLIDELKIWIYNKWGQLLFYCNDSDTIENKASCPWDGTFSGQIVPPGSYVVKIEYKNKSDHSVQSVTRSLMVLNYSK
ncbi:hypothetical protein [Cecembia rubra]|nr:hypothetical protein [Cecembia rubra]